MLSLLLVLTACSSGGNNEKTTINIPTASTTGALYPLGASLANMWNQNIDYIKANAQASDGGIDNLNLLQYGEAQVSMAVVSNVYESYNGLNKFEDRANKDIRIIGGLYYNPNQLVVRSDAGIESISDLKGKKFVSGAPGSTTEIESGIHLKSAGVNYPDDLEVQYVGFNDAIDLFRNKQIDGAWIMSGIPTAAVSEILATTDTKILPIEIETIESMKEEYPWYTSYTIKAGTYDKQNEDVNTSAIKMVLFTSATLDDDTVYDLTKVFWENIDSLKETHNSLKEVEVENALMDLADLPIHDGAMRYYEEIGIAK